jgi:hypothetical protein
VKWIASSNLKRVDHAAARREHIDFNDSFALRKGRARRRPGIRVLLGEEILPVEIVEHFFRPLIGKTQKIVES